jgi:hypothetical protein
MLHRCTPTSPRQNYPSVGAELTPPAVVDVSSTSNHAAQRAEESPSAEEPTYATLRSDDDARQSTARRTGVNKILTRFALTTQLPRLRLPLAACLLVACIGTMGVYFLSLVTGTPVSVFTRDPATVTKSRPLIGLLSTLGIMGWAAAVAICFMGAGVLSHDRRHRPLTWFLFASGMLCLWLLLDDALLFHDYIFPEYLHVPEIYAYIGYTAVFAGYFLYFVRQILLTDYLILMLAWCFLGVSVTIDTFLPFSHLVTFVEDSFKFYGIVFWLGYLAHTVQSASRHPLH